MAMTTQNWQVWKPEIQAYIQDELDLMPKSLYSELFSVRTTNLLQVQEVDYASFTPMLAVGELGDAVEDQALEGYKYAYQQQFYRKSTTFGARLLETDQVGEVEKIARLFAQTIEYSRNLWIFSMFRNAFNSLITYGDGKPLVSVSHPIKSGLGTQANTFLDGVQRPMTYDNVLALQDVLYQTVSNNGNIMQLGAEGRNKVLVCAYPLREKAFQIAGVKASIEKPNTADRAANYFKQGDRYDVMILPYVNYEAARQAGETTVAKSAAGNYWDSMWGVFDTDIMKRFFKVYMASGYARFDEEIQKSNQSLIKYAYDSYAYGNTAFFGCTLSKGDNSTYAS